VSEREERGVEESGGGEREGKETGGCPLTGGNNCPRLEAVPHMVVAYFNMFGCLVKDRISSQ
jgi:hypothetical protein